jgi:hypothetical protein
MRLHHDWLPGNHEEIYNKANQTVAYLTGAVLTRIGIAGAVLIWYRRVFMIKYAAFRTAFENWLNPAERTPSKTTILQDAEREFVTVYGQFYNGYMRENLLVTNDDLQACGFPKRHFGDGTPAGKPDTLIEMETETSKPAEVTIHYYDAENLSEAKPEGVHGGEFVIVVRAAGEPAPKDWKELTTSVFSTRTPLTLTFTGEQRGMILYFASRWENTRGEKGPWNAIQWVIIP